MSPKIITSGNLDSLIVMIVPEEYLPDAKLENGCPLLGVYLTSLKEVEKRGWTKDAIAGLTDMGALAAKAKMKDPELEGRYIIRILEGIPYYAAGAALAHEMGHLVSLLEEGDGSEEAAELWAMKRIVKLDIPMEEKVEFLTYIDDL